MAPKALGDSWRVDAGHSMTVKPWDHAMADANEEPVPGSAEEALRQELVYLWSDLDIAIRQTIRGPFTPPEAWSMHSLAVATRIIILSRLVGATPWEQVGYDRLLDGTYQRLLIAAGIEHTTPSLEDLRKMLDWKHGQREAARSGR